MKLIKPNAKYKQSYISLIEAFKDQNEDLIPFPLMEDYTDFQAMIERLNGYENGIGLRPDFVRHATYWLIDDMENVVAVSNLRLELTDALRYFGGHIGYGVKPSERRKGYATFMLKETLKRASSFGLKEVLLTINVNNIGSNKTVLNNAGVLDSTEFISQRKLQINRYWIQT